MEPILIAEPIPLEEPNPIRDTIPSIPIPIPLNFLKVNVIPIPIPKNIGIITPLVPGHTRWARLMHSPTTLSSPGNQPWEVLEFE